MAHAHQRRARTVPGRGAGLSAYGVVRAVLRPTFRVLYRLDVIGGANVPADGAAIVVANHLSALDPFVIGVAVPRDVHFMAKEELWRRRPVGWSVERLGGFPVGRGRGDRDAVEHAVSLLRAGRVIGVFPQGRVRGDGPWLRGAARMALITGAPIVPLRLFDTDRALTGRRVGLPHLRVAIGGPIAVPPASPTIAASRELTARLQRAVEWLPDPAA